MQAQQVSTYYSFMKMNMLDKFLIEYYDRFSENSSIFTVSNTEENKFVKIIKKCLDNDRSYKTETNKKHFYKKPAGKIWWLDTSDRVGEFLFSFDREKVFNLFADYPHNLTPEQKEIFDKENPYWKDFFKDRQ